MDMERSFSVFLFGFAMDPLFYYLNRIPEVLAVEAYVDDTTIIGNAQSLEWIQKVSDTYRKVKTAGFIVDFHTCYRALSNSVMRFSPQKLTDEELLVEWPNILESDSYLTARCYEIQLRPWIQYSFCTTCKVPPTSPDTRRQAG